MLLNKENLTRIPPHPSLRRPDPRVFTLPEKVLQFGTGVFIRGLIDYFIDKANNAGQFNGRVVMVKSTAAGTTDADGSPLPQGFSCGRSMRSITTSGTSGKPMIR